MEITILQGINTCILLINPYIWYRNQPAMGKLSATEIEATGESHIEEWLIENGYSNIMKQTLFPDEREIMAVGNVETILIQVRTFVYPGTPFKLTETETHKIRLRASINKNVAYAAYVVIDENKNLVGEIIWERLS